MSRAALGTIDGNFNSPSISEGKACFHEPKEDHTSTSIVERDPGELYPFEVMIREGIVKTEKGIDLHLIGPEF